ncbi:MAG: hypothetical protein AUG51_02770 [Acidobacteria bacterium 13_1_20CM_3_53_8]|nr:MAG: hypothetical protein AUG51_02770 [Acidobacteria bacterium 13_1_20CM_3_53_8]
MEATLMTHVGARKVTRQELSLVPTPPSTDTFKPIAHAALIDELESSLAFRHISVVREEYAISPDSMRLFGLLELNAVYEGVRFAIGLRNANDKSMRLGMVAGYRVFVCDNMALSGDFKPLLAKHTKHFNLVDSLSTGVDRIQRGFQPLREAIDSKRGYQLREEEARSLIYQAFTEKRLPLKLLKTVHREFFIAPSHEEFKAQTIWSLENAFTTAFKELKPVKQYEAAAKLGKFLQPYTQAF